MRSPLTVRHRSHRAPAAMVALLILVALPLGRMRAEEAAETPVSLPSAAAPWHVELKDNRLSAVIFDASLRTVMDEVGKLTGAEVVWVRPDSEERVSVEFEELPLNEALGRILGERNFLLSYSRAQASQEIRLSQIRVYAKGKKEAAEASPVTVKVVPRDPEEEVTAAILRRQALEDSDPRKRLEAVESLRDELEEGETPEIFQKILRSEKDAEVREAALDALSDMHSPPVDPFIDTLLHDPDPALRAMALENLESMIEENPRAREAISAARNDPDPEVRDYANELLEEEE